MKKPLKHKSKIQTILAIGRPIIILALALVTAVSVITPAHAVLPLLAVYLIVGALVTLGGGAIAWFGKAQIIKGMSFMIAEILLGLVQLLITVLQPLLIPIITVIIAFGLGNPNFLLNESYVNVVWSVAIKIANAAFLLVLLIAAIAIITRLNTGMYNLKKFLGGFIMAVALCNFSLIIVKAMVTLGDKLTQAVIDMAAPLGVSLPAVTGAPDSANTTGAVAAYFITMIGMQINPGKWTVPELAISVAETAVFIITAWVIIKFGLILIERMVRLFAAAVIAPLVFAGSLLPNFQKIAAGWWETTIKWILVLPITMAFMIISLMFFAKAGINTPADMANIHTILLPDFIRDAIMAYSKGKVPTDPGTDAIANFSYAAMGLFVLWSAGMVSNKFDLKSVMGGLVETPQRAIALGQKGYKTVADAVTGKGPAGKAIGYARGVTGGALNLATSRIPEKSKFGFLRGAGTKLGAIPEVFSKGRVYATKVRERAKTSQANEWLSQIGSTRPAKALSGDSNIFLSGQRADLYKEMGEFASGGQATDVMARNIVKASKKGNIRELTLWQGIMERVKNNKRVTSPEQVKEIDQLQRALMSGDTTKANQALATVGVTDEKIDDIGKFMNLNTARQKDKYILKSWDRLGKQPYTKQTSDVRFAQNAANIRLFQKNLIRKKTPGKRSYLNGSEATAIIDGENSVALSQQTEADKTLINNPGDINTLVDALRNNKISSDKLNEFIKLSQDNDIKGAGNILTTAGVSLSGDGTEALSQSAKSVRSADALRVRIGLIGIARMQAGGTRATTNQVSNQLDILITALENAKQLKKDNVNIKRNQQDEVRQALGNYTTAVSSKLKGGAHEVVNFTSTFGGPMNITTVKSAATTGNAVKGRLDTLLQKQLEDNPMPENAAQNLKLNQLTNLATTDQQAIVNMLKNLGLDPTIKTDSDVNTILKHLRLMGQMK